MSDNQNKAPQSPDKAVSSDLLQSLVQLLLEERREALERREEAKKAFEARRKQREINAAQNLADLNRIQSICSHRKGGKGLKGPKVDYAVSFHTFINGESYIRCLICGMKWKNRDTQEFLYRRGKKIPNHTGMGWREAYNMVLDSSNTATSSEVQLTATTEPYEIPDFEKSPHAVEI
ncbi:MAG TPA: hypothetical protein VFA52_04625 [Candidatus Paceibacterota bacterium]|nr:hypothetical protein [Candidatus Paceibacterota bacterium]